MGEASILIGIIIIGAVLAVLFSLVLPREDHSEWTTEMNKKLKKVNKWKV